MAKLISFDIDGTLETGDPPGCITMERVREVQALGYIIGSCSDRTVSTQQRMWMEHGITKERVLARNRPIGNGSSALWRVARQRIDDLDARGLFPPGPASTEPGTEPGTEPSTEPSEGPSEQSGVEGQ